jgi:hypothetical protein
VIRVSPRRDPIHSLLDKGGATLSKVERYIVGSSLDKLLQIMKLCFTRLFNEGVDSGCHVSDPSIVLNKKIALQAELRIVLANMFPLIVLSSSTAIFYYL